MPRIHLSSVNVNTIDGMNTAATGLLIWNTNSSVVNGKGIGFYYFDGTIWQAISDNQRVDTFQLIDLNLNISLENDNQPTQVVDLSSLANDWKFTGNVGTIPTLNFIGTLDNQDLSFRTNNVLRMQLTTKGQLELNTSNSIFIGFEAGESEDLIDRRNTFIGYQNGMNTTIGSFNSSIGYQAFYYNISGSYNMAFGNRSLFSNSSGQYNTGIGFRSLYNNSTGNFNTAIGSNSLYDNQNSNYNTAIGYNSLTNNEGDNNVAIGHITGTNDNNLTQSVYIGSQAGSNGGIGAKTGNIFIGYRAGYSETGSNKLYIENSDADENNALIYGNFSTNRLRTNGEFQVRQNSSTSLNHLVLSELQSNDGGRIRFDNSVETDNFWILYGRADDTNSDSRFNIYNSVAGDILRINGDGNVGLLRNPTTNRFEVNGDASKTTAGSWLANSDRRLKTNITTILPQDALNKIIKLRGVTFYWNDNKTGNDRPKNLQLGFIAQELQEVFPEKVFTDKQGYLQTAYGDYDPVIFQAIKALDDKIKNLEIQILELKKIIKDKF